MLLLRLVELLDHEYLELGHIEGYILTANHRANGAGPI